MKKIFANYYNRIVLLIWVMFVFILWLQYIFLSSIVEATLFLIILVPGIISTHILANVLLPQALHRKREKVFIAQFIGVTLINAFFLAVCYYAISIAAIKGYLPPSDILIDNNSLLVEFIFTIPTILIINFGFCGLRFFYENIRLQRVNLETQIQILQSQINPHFMFNVLNHMHVLIRTNTELASDLLLQYSDMLRFQLYKGKSDRVLLEEEVQFMKNYVEIEKLRWGDKLSVECDWNIADKNMKIPPLLLFPFIENAFKYASRTIENTGLVHINLKQQDGGFTFEVINSKSTSNSHKKPEASGIGLSNTQKRLHLIFGDNHCLRIKDEKDTYYLKLDVCRM